MPKVPLYLLLRVLERLEWRETRHTTLQEKLSPDHGEKLDSNIVCKDGATSDIQFGKCVGETSASIVSVEATYT